VCTGCKKEMKHDSLLRPALTSRITKKDLLDRIERSVDEEGIEPATSCNLVKKMLSKRSTPELHAREGVGDVEDRALLTHITHD
jgi:hypothetical protein